MAGIWQHRLVFSIHLGSNISDWFDLPCVTGVIKHNGRIVVSLKNVIFDGLMFPGVSYVTIGHRLLCRDEEGYWWCLNQEVYESLDEEQHVTRFPNKETYQQVRAIKVANKLQRDFDKLPHSEKEDLFNQYPDLIIKTDDNN